MPATLYIKIDYKIVGLDNNMIDKKSEYIFAKLFSIEIYIGKKIDFCLEKLETQKICWQYHHQTGALKSKKKKSNGICGSYRRDLR